MTEPTEAPSMVIPHRAEIRCNKNDDEYVIEFIEHFKFKQLDYVVIVEERPDIDIKFFDMLDTLIDQIGLLHKG
jgi:DNA-dependent RNA polymerase auxiliary subunit epsilon